MKKYKSYEEGLKVRLADSAYAKGISYRST